MIILAKATRKGLEFYLDNDLIYVAKNRGRILIKMPENKNISNCRVKLRLFKWKGEWNFKFFDVGSSLILEQPLFKDIAFGKIEEDLIEVRFHSGFTKSFFINNTQVGFCQRLVKNYINSNSLKIVINNNISIDLICTLVFAFCHNPDNDSDFDLGRIDRSKYSFDKNWLPNDLIYE